MTLLSLLAGLTILVILVTGVVGAAYIDGRYAYPARRRLVLLLLKEGPGTGLELKARGAPRASLYVILNRLEDEGLVESRINEDPSPLRGGIPQRIYRLSAKGWRGATTDDLHRGTEHA